MIQWPDFKMPPMNLWTVMPADRFYASPEDQMRMAWEGSPVMRERNRALAKPAQHPAAIRMTLIMAAR